MIRLFTALCKSLLEVICDEELFKDATGRYRYHNETCPCCGAAGKISAYGSYSRNLVYHKGGKIIDSRVMPLRFKCKSCGATHALLPDIIIPYSPYNLVFVLTVLIAYFDRETTVVNICERFGIAVSTLYEWKKRIASHKDLMLGILISQKTPTLAFLRGLLGHGALSETLRTFFHKYGFSFMQNRPASASRSRPP